MNSRFSAVPKDAIYTDFIYVDLQNKQVPPGKRFVAIGDEH